MMTCICGNRIEDCNCPEKIEATRGRPRDIRIPILDDIPRYLRAIFKRLLWYVLGIIMLVWMAGHLMVIGVFLFFWMVEWIFSIAGFNAMWKYLSSLSDNIEDEKISRAWYKAQSFATSPEPDIWSGVSHYLEASEIGVWIFHTHILTAMMIFAGIVFCFGVMKLFKPRLDKIRGIVYYKGEGMIAGSAFIAGTMPGCQIQVFRNNTITKTFLGYAIRISDSVIAMPIHVYNLAGGKLLLGSEKSSQFVYVEQSKIDSMINSDLCYVNLTNGILAQLQVTVANLCKKTTANMAVSIMGPDGQSSGFLTQHQSPGMVVYKGSTKPGYSGAAYFAGRMILGMHCGMAGDLNVGVSSILINQEAQMLYPMLKGEGSITFSSPGGRDDYEEEQVGKAKKKKHYGWTEKSLADTLKASINTMRTTASDWVDFDEVDYDADLNFENSNEYLEELADGLEKMPPVHLELLLKQIEILKSKRELKMTGQGTENTETTLDDAMSNLMLRMGHATRKIEQDVANLANKVQTLEKEQEEMKKDYLAKYDKMIEAHSRVLKEKELKHVERVNKQLTKEKRQPPRNQFGCDKCEKSFKTETGLLMHNSVKHAETAIKGEALNADEKDTTKKSGNPAFLAKRYPVRKFVSLKKPLPSLDMTSACRSLIKSQRNTENLLNQLAKSLESLVKNTAGPSSAITQN